MKYQFTIAKQNCKYEKCEQAICVNADPKAVERALANLITNATKYSEPGATTKISVIVKDGMVAINVEDEGPGIPHDELEKIFEAYFRAKDETRLTARGTGLGLAIVKHIMDAHNGKIEVKSTVGKGSSFTLLFPIIKDEKNINN
jgi:two-component system phosphate regulon sensor histidine kinase PhoR